MNERKHGIVVCSYLLFVLLIIPFATWAGDAHPGPLNVYVVNYPLRYFAERIGGEHVKVEFPVQPDQDPAYWVPGIKTISEYQQADLILLNGASYAKWVRKVSLPRSKMVDTSVKFKEQYITADEVVTHSHGAEGAHAHESLAFTTWLDFDLAAKQARMVMEALSRKKPKAKDFFKKNYAALEHDLLALDREIKRIVARKISSPLVASHPVYDYLARRYGLNLKSVHWEPDEFPSIAQWSELGTMLKKHPAKWMIWEGKPIKESTERLKAIGLNSLVFDPCGNTPDEGDFLNVMRQNGENLGRSFQYYIAMKALSKYFIPVVVLVLCFLNLIVTSKVLADSPHPKSIDSFYKALSERVEKGVRGPVGDWHYYLKDGLHMDSPEKNLTFRANLSVMVDGGYIGADDELEGAFPDLEGSSVELRQLKVSFLGALYHWAEFKLSIDFANVRDIQDEWIQFTKIPYIGHITLGYMKEPFSLENWTSLKSVTFMERALSTEAFAPGRNFGIRRHTTVLDQRMTWAVGAFLNTGSFSDVGDSKDQISEANGWDLTARITGLPLYEENGQKLLHLGFSYSHQLRGEDVESGFRTRPESRLTDDRLVDTGEYFTDSSDLIDAEFAIVNGPLSFQGEYFHLFENADELGNPNFWGFYLFGNYFITGEHRNYSRQSGTFFSLEPKHHFRPFKGGWGAWELTSRFSYIDLNSGDIRGGKELDFTAGLNWYLNRKTRFMFNYIRAKVEDRETPLPVDSGHADIFQVRFQFIW